MLYWKILIKKRNKNPNVWVILFNLCCGNTWCTSRSVLENLGCIYFAWKYLSQWKNDLIIWIMQRERQKRLPKSSLPSKYLSVSVVTAMWCTLVLVWLVNHLPGRAFGCSQSSKTAGVIWTSRSARFCTSGVMTTTEMEFLGSGLVELWLFWMYSSH